MSNAQLIELLHELRLSGFREELEHQLQIQRIQICQCRTGYCECCKLKPKGATGARSID